MVVVDSGPLVAAAIQSDREHARCVAFFEQTREPLVVPQVVLTEARFVRGLAVGTITLDSLDAIDLIRTADLIDRYADLDLGIVDAAVIATAERLGADRIATIDRRHFTVVRPAHVDYLTLLP